jgi:hypothetical protein
MLEYKKHYDTRFAVSKRSQSVDNRTQVLEVNVRIEDPRYFEPKIKIVK